MSGRSYSRRPSRRSSQRSSNRSARHSSQSLTRRAARRASANTWHIEDEVYHAPRTTSTYQFDRHNYTAPPQQSSRRYEPNRSWPRESRYPVAVRPSLVSEIAALQARQRDKQRYERRYRDYVNFMEPPPPPPPPKMRRRSLFPS